MAMTDAAAFSEALSVIRGEYDVRIEAGFIGLESFEKPAERGVERRHVVFVERLCSAKLLRSIGITASLET